jgi:hypothetical protein
LGSIPGSHRNSLTAVLPAAGLLVNQPDHSQSPSTQREPGRQEIPHSPQFASSLSTS